MSGIKVLEGQVIPDDKSLSESDDYFQISEYVEDLLEKKFMHQVKKLDSALELSGAAQSVQEGLRDVRRYIDFEFGEDETTKILQLPSDPPQASEKSRTLLRHTNRGLSKYSNDSEMHIDVCSIERLTDALLKFSTAIDHFDSYTDRESNDSLRKVQTAYWELYFIMKFFEKTERETEEFKEFVDDRLNSLRGDLWKIRGALERFLEVGIPCISHDQKRAAEKLLNATTVATFFASVVASSLQISAGQSGAVDSALLSTVDALWLTSLILSIASAFNSMLAMTMRKTIFSTPMTVQPWYIRFWVRQSYLHFLIASVGTFLVGLVFYVFLTQRRSVFWVIVGFTSFCALGLLLVSAWFLRERLEFARVSKSKRAAIMQALEFPFVSSFQALRSPHSRRKGSARLQNSELIERSWSPSDVVQAASAFLSRFFPSIFPGKEVDMEDWLPEAPHEEQLDADMNTLEVKSRRDRSPTPIREYTDEECNSYGDKLKDMRPLYDLSKDDKVRQMQFSPDGRWLAVCYEYECRMYNTENPRHSRTLWHYCQFAEQVDWSPNSKRILTKVKECVQLWKLDGDKFEKESSYDLDEPVSRALWISDESIVVLIDDVDAEYTFYKLNLQGKTKTGYKLPPEVNVTAIYATRTPDQVICIGGREIEGLRDKYIDCLIVYNMVARTSSSFTPADAAIPAGTIGRIERKIPLLDNIQSLTIHDQHLLLSYHNRAPELWKIHHNAAKLSRCKTQTITFSAPRNSSGLWGRGFFAGPGGCYVVFPLDGTLYFWHRNERRIIGSLPIAGKIKMKLPKIVWNSARDLPMLAVAVKNKKVKIWGWKSSELLEVGQTSELHDESSLNGSEAHSRRSGVENDVTGRRRSLSTTGLVFKHQMSALGRALTPKRKGSIDGHAQQKSTEDLSSKLSPVEEVNKDPESIDIEIVPSGNKEHSSTVPVPDIGLENVTPPAPVS